MIAATFHGPNYWSPNHDESTIEVFESMGHAMAALFERYDAHGKRPLPVRYLDGNHGNIRFPNVEYGTGMDCYAIDSDLPPLGQPIDGAAVLDALSDVHMNIWDYRLTLMPPFGRETSGSVAVSVARREQGKPGEDYDSRDIPVVHLVRHPLPAKWLTACGIRPPVTEDITAAKDHVTCPECKDTDWYRTMPAMNGA